MYDSDYEPISRILEKASTVHRSFGRFGGIVVMLAALWAARRKSHWVLGLIGAVAGSKWAGLL